MTDEDILMAMEMTARAEREMGFTGYGKPPAEVLDACNRLVERGLAEEQKFNKGWFRPTKEGADLVAPRIRRVQ